MVIVSSLFEIAVAISNRIICLNVEKTSFKEVILSPVITDSVKRLSVSVACMTFSKSGKFLAVCTSDKRLLIYDSNSSIIRCWNILRAASKIVFTIDDLNVLVADKTGDVYLYKMNEEGEPPAIILGHLSIIVDVSMTICGKYIITSDRDEKIRISHFPNSYNIRSYCLGHTEFITRIEQIDDSTIVSSSGDGTVRFWNLDGDQIGIIAGNNYISDTNVLSEFIGKMTADNINTKALPVIDIVLSQSGDYIHLAVQILEVNEVQLYHITKSHGQITAVLLQLIPCETRINGFSFYQNILYILLENAIKPYHYSVDSNKYVSVENNFINNVLEENEIKLCDININDKILALYKRTFDNLQDYRERKKIRLEK